MRNHTSNREQINKGPMCVEGGRSAGLTCLTTATDKQIIGKRRMHNDADAIDRFMQGTQENRNKMMEP